MDGLAFYCISEASRQLLEVEFSEDEVFEGLMSCNGSKAPGPNRFNMKFLRSFWYLLKEDILCIFKSYIPWVN